jgi:hypothetical protein
MSERVTGYLLLIIGVLLVIGSLAGVYFVFTGRIQPYPIFNLPAITLDLSGLMEAEGQEAQQLSESGASLQTELVKGEVLNKPLNLVASLLFMSFLLNVGFKIGSLGVQLIRPIKVVLKGEKSILEP